MGIPAGYRAVLEHTDTWFRLIRKPPWDYRGGYGDCLFHYVYGHPDFFCPERESQGGNQGGSHDKGNGGNYDFQRPVLAGDF